MPPEGRKFGQHGQNFIHIWKQPQCAHIPRFGLWRIYITSLRKLQKTGKIT